MEGETISEAARRCEKLFNDLVELLQVNSEGADNSQLLGKSMGLMQQFDVWVSFLGVFASEMASLDWRLRDDGKMRDVLQLLLSSIRINLAWAVDSQSGQDSDCYLMLESNLTSVQDAMDRLELLSKMIRQPPTAGLYYRVNAFAEKNKDEEFDRLVFLLVRHQYRHGPESICNQIAKSILFRRYRWLYSYSRQRRSRKRNLGIDPSLTAQQQEAEPSQHIDGSISVVKAVTCNLSNDAAAQANNISHSKLPSSQSHIDTATAASDFKLPDTATSVTFIPEDVDNFPAIPNQQGDLQVQCPHCSQQLMQHELTQAGWRRHWEDDVEPYVCISEKCSQLQYFSRVQDWRSHMATHSKYWVSEVHAHVYWTCDIDHEAISFNVEEGLQHHLKETHGRLYSKTELLAMSEMSQRTHCRDSNTCPLCTASPAKPARTPRDSQQSLTLEPQKGSTESADEDEITVMNQHIEGHLRQLAQMSSNLDMDPYNVAIGAAKKYSCEASTSRQGFRSSSLNSEPFDINTQSEISYDDIEESGLPSASQAVDWSFLRQNDQQSVSGSQITDTKLHDESNSSRPSANRSRRKPTSSSRKIRTRPLSDTIFNSFVTSTFLGDHQRFLPEGKIDELIHKESVVREIQLQTSSRASPDAEAWLTVEFILAKAKKIFAIATFIGMHGRELLRAMQWFQNNDIFDRSLPLNMDTWKIDGGSFKEGISTGSGSSGSDSNYSSSSEPNGPDHPWTNPKIRFFCDRQWEFIAPVLSFDAKNYAFSSFSILPFTDRHSDNHVGAFGRVTRYKIHPSHLVGADGSKFECPEFVAVKKIEGDRKSVEDVWNSETKVHRKLNSLNQPNIVRLLAAFQHGTAEYGDRYLVLEWADGGNLRNLWATFERPKLTGDLVKDMTHQLLGLSGAVKEAHYPANGAHVRHGDLKPENILWFKDQKSRNIGTLKIGDWGLAKQHEVATEQRNKMTDTDWGTKCYEPPEEATGHGIDLTRHGRPTRMRSRLYDIWALGCVYFEFIIWALYGVDELRRFNVHLAAKNPDAPRFYQIRRHSGGQLEAKVHDVVAKWMDHMLQDPICKPGQTALGNLLIMVKSRLLVVRLPDNLGSQEAGSHTEFEAADIPELALLPRVIICDPEEAGLGDNAFSTTQKRLDVIRARATEVLDEALSIVESTEEKYWFSGQPLPCKGPNLGEEFETHTSKLTERLVLDSSGSS